MAQHDLDAPARLLWWPTTPQAKTDWKLAKTYSTLREAVAAAVDAPPNEQQPWILTDTAGLDKNAIETVWEHMNKVPDPATDDAGMRPKTAG